MTATLAELLGIAEASALTLFATFLRVGGAMALLPAFGEQNVPERVRLALAIAFTAIVAPMASTSLAPAVAATSGPPLWLGAEILAGLILGIVVRLLVMALHMAGSIAAQSTSLSQIFGGSAVDPLPAMGHILMIGGLALAVMFGLHIRVAELLIYSYEIFPPGQLPGADLITDWSLLRVSRAFSLAFTLAAPFVIASFIYNVALGVINRAMPQLMVAFVGAPAITAGGMILLALTAPILLETWRLALFGFLGDPFGGH